VPRRPRWRLLSFFPGKRKDPFSFPHEKIYVIKGFSAYFVAVSDMPGRSRSSSTKSSSSRRRVFLPSKTTYTVSYTNVTAHWQSIHKHVVVGGFYTICGIHGQVERVNGVLCLFEPGPPPRRYIIYEPRRPKIKGECLPSFLGQEVCYICQDGGDEDKLLLCDHDFIMVYRNEFDRCSVQRFSCNRAAHTFCVGLKRVPSGEWFCNQCNLHRHKKKKPATGPMRNR
jgi:hypothetical protein